VPIHPVNASRRELSAFSFSLASSGGGELWPNADELSGPFRIINTRVQHGGPAGKWIMGR
jgi:hypothetical protein